MERTLETIGLAFDVGTVLGIGNQNPNPIEGRPGFITLRTSEGISPVSLRGSTIGQQRIWQDVRWYDLHGWSGKFLLPGTYHLRLPVADSNRKSFDEQEALLSSSEEVAPLVLAELGLLCLHEAGYPDPLRGRWVRCAE